MKVYTAQTNKGRTLSRDDIHHETFDSGKANRVATAKAQRKAARRFKVIDYLDMEDEDELD